MFWPRVSSNAIQAVLLLHQEKIQTAEGKFSLCHDFKINLWARAVSDGQRVSGRYRRCILICWAERQSVGSLQSFKRRNFPLKLWCRLHALAVVLPQQSSGHDCEECDASCLECRGPGSANCTMCPPQAILEAGGRCLLCCRHEGGEDASARTQDCCNCTETRGKLKVHTYKERETKKDW